MTWKKIIPTATIFLLINYSAPAQATTLVRDWIQEVLNSVSRNPRTTGPTVASRAYGILGTAMYDAWSAYEERPMSTILDDQLQRPESENTLANKEQAISFAAYRVLSELFPSETPFYDSLMNRYGYDPGDLSTDTTTPTGIGNVISESLMEFRRNDGSNQLNNYQDTTGYVPINSPDVPLVDITRWTPEHVPIDNPDSNLQTYLTPQWGDVIPFSLDTSDQFRPTPPESFLLDDQATANLAEGTITRRDGTVVQISPALIGVDINPGFIQQAERVVEIHENLTDEQRAIAEFWEDGGGSYFPPGHWLEFGIDVAERDNHNLDEDIQLFFPLTNALFDAGIATWEAKRNYNYTRPVRAIRELARLGLIDSSQVNFTTYQNPNGPPSPPFPEHTSGHSAFSAAGAKILQSFTGSDNLGMGVTITDSRFFPGTFEQPVSLFWDTFTEASQQAGMSRLYGGIHFEQGNNKGRILGTRVGQTAWRESQYYVNGGQPVNEPSAIGGSILLMIGYFFKNKIIRR